MNKITILIFLIAIVFSLSQDYNFSVEDKKVEALEGFVVSEISESDKTQSFIFEGIKGIRVLVKTNKYFEYSYGDKISLSGELKIPENFENENGIIFNYQKYLLKDGITHTAFYPKIEVLERGSPAILLGAGKKDLKFYIFKFKSYFVSQSKRIFTSQTNSLVLGVLLGVKDSIDQGLKENFRRTGLIHILVLSGFNLTIIAYFIFKLLGSVHRNIRYILSLFFIFAFTIMVGAGATIVRAGIMISLFIFSKLLYRNSNSSNALILAGSIMIFVNPMILLYDPSFQLSFVATLGLVSFYPILEKLLFFLPNKLSIKEIVVSNISVQLTVVPLLIYMMGEFSIISLIPNIFVLPLIPIFMLISFLSIVCSLIPNSYYLVLVFITEKLSNFIVGIVNYFGNLNFAIVKVGQISPRLLLIILFFYFSIIFVLDLRKKFISKQKYNYLRF